MSEPVKVACPKCGELIDKLEYANKGSRGGEFFINPFTDTEIYNERWGNSDSTVFSCPECDEILFHNDQDAAMEFLKGGVKDADVQSDMGN